ncbi:MAG: FAD-dependent oxidoreductase [Planctomycetales bacterium]|nr:FAD-dependent oxidoreductase [Planctomycetales bacterium]
MLLGIGHTNAHVVKEWQTDPIPGCKLICISKFPTATYSGMLPGTLGRQFRDDEMRIDLKGLVDRAGAELVIAETSGLDLEGGELHFSDRPPLRFDALSIGVGSMPAGWQQHSGSPLMVPIKPMQTFLHRLDEHLRSATTEPASPLRVAIVGGGVSSVEIALCLQQRIKKGQDPFSPLTVQIFTSGRIAEGMRAASVRRIEKLLASRQIDVYSGQRVVGVGDRELETEDGNRHGADCVIWATGAVAPPVLRTLGLQTDGRGFIATGKTLQSLTDDRIFAVGDSGTVMESPSPKAGVYAVRQCPILWHNLRAFFNHSPMRSFEPQSDFLKLLNTGDGKALIEYGWLTAHARWCWRLKTWIDKRFVGEFQ